MDETLRMMEELTTAVGVPGQEHEVREVMARYLAPLGEVMTDNLGSIVGVKTGRGVDKERAPRVLVAGHMDEVGFMITLIDEDGFLKFQTLGGWWEQVMLAQRVTIRTHKGDIVGVFGSKPPHILTADERKKMVDKRDMFIDIGVTSKEEAIEVGVRPGDPAVPICPFTVMANDKMLLAKAWDNRFGCALALQTLKEVGADHPNTIYAGATVQEEVGLRGATTLANKVEPDVAISLDVAIAGGTDGGRFQLAGSGVPSITISIASRYIHSAASMVNRDDFDNATRLMVALMKRLDAATVADLKR